jgi:hypothetical protein
MMKKFVGYFRLLEVCDQPGCPLCRCVIRESRGYLDALLYEQVTDPETRRAIRSSWGFCNWHTWMLLEVEHSTFGSAIIYEDLIKLALKRMEGVGSRAARSAPRRWRWRFLTSRRRRGAATEPYRERTRCPACVSVAAAERRDLETLVAFIDDGDLQAAYARSDGLCVPHLFAAVDAGGDRPGVRALVDRTRENWQRVGREIGAFVSKHDHRNREPYTEAEAASSMRAFEILVGARGVFGNAVHDA